MTVPNTPWAAKRPTVHFQFVSAKKNPAVALARHFVPRDPLDMVESAPGHISLTQKIAIKQLFAATLVVAVSELGDWLIQNFSFRGFRFQHWMPIILVILILMMIYGWWYDRRD
jgi:hypothetical protein